ncbi:MAG: hypothetical protein AB7P99_15160 [Vicinamibacterales bacterium]
MRRLSGVLLAGAVLLLPAFSQNASAQGAEQAAPAQQQTAQANKLTFTGDTVVWMFTINAGKEADFEEVVQALKMALASGATPEAAQQAPGWKILKGPAQPDGSIVYTHLISPVVPNADYGVMANIYAAVKDPTQQKALYDKYAGAFKANLAQVQLTTVATMGQ